MRQFNASNNATKAKPSNVLKDIESLKITHFNFEKINWL